jgi:hypothetical protein
MAIKLNNNVTNLRVICRIDSAIPEDLTDQEWDLYQNNLNESHLRLCDKPTYFIMKRSLNFGAQQNISNQQIKLNQEGQATIQIGYMLEEVRCALVDIENPPNISDDEQIKFVKEIDGYASKELIAKLNSAGIVSQLFAIRTAIINKANIPTKK